MSFFELDLTNVSPEGSREPIEAGVYIAQIEKVEQRTSKAKPQNKYLNVMYKLIDNPSKNGFVIFDMVTTHNDNDKAQDIGRKRLKAMFVATGFSEEALKASNPGSLVGKKVRITVVIKKDDRTNENRNVVASILPVAGKDKMDTMKSDDLGLGFI